MIRDTKLGTEDRLSDVFTERQEAQSVSTPRTDGIVSAADMRMAGVQATQNVIAINQQVNQHQIIQTQNCMLVVKDMQAEYRRSSANGDAEMNCKFTVD